MMSALAWRAAVSDTAVSVCVQPCLCAVGSEPRWRAGFFERNSWSCGPPRQPRHAGQRYVLCQLETCIKSYLTKRKGEGGTAPAFSHLSLSLICV